MRVKIHYIKEEMDHGTDIQFCHDTKDQLAKQRTMMEDSFTATSKYSKPYPFGTKDDWSDEWTCIQDLLALNTDQGIKDAWALWKEEQSNGGEHHSACVEEIEVSAPPACEHGEELLQALKNIRDANNPDDENSYRCDDREGCLDYTHATAIAAIAKCGGGK